MRGTGRVEVRDVEVQRDAGVRVTWTDDVTAEFSLAGLRANCPCAGCRSVRDRGEVPWPPPGVTAAPTIVEADLVGGWGLRLTWDDGHSTGIYPWDALRSWQETRG